MIEYEPPDDVKDAWADTLKKSSIAESRRLSGLLQAMLKGYEDSVAGGKWKLAELQKHLAKLEAERRAKEVVLVTGESVLVEVSTSPGEYSGPDYGNRNYMEGALRLKGAFCAGPGRPFGELVITGMGADLAHALSNENMVKPHPTKIRVTLTLIEEEDSKP